MWARWSSRTLLNKTAVQKLEEQLASNTPSTTSSIFTSLFLSRSIRDINQRDVNKIISLPEKDTRTLFADGYPGARPHRPVLDENGRVMFPQVEEARATLPRNKLFADRHIVVRKVMIDAAVALEKLRADAMRFASARGFILNGEVGSGKSTVLAFLVLHCRANGWLVVNIPFARDWMYMSPEWVKVPKQPGIYDQPDIARTLLTDVKAAEADKLSKLPMRHADTLAWFASGGKKSAKEHTLLDLVNRGLGDDDLAVTAALRLRDELNLVTEYPVLLAIDEYNHLYDQTVYHDQHGRLLPQQLRMIARWRQFDGDAMANGVVVAATSYTASTVRPLNAKAVASRRGELVHVPTLSLEEMRSFLAVMHRQGQMQNEAGDEAVAIIHTLSGGRAMEAERVVTFSPY